MTIPARYRDGLLEEAHGGLTLTLNFENSLLVYPRFEWEKLRERLIQLPASHARVQRVLLGNAFDVDIDKAGRVLVPPQLRAKTQIDKDVVLVGMGNRFDLWDAEQYEAVLARDLAAGLPEDLSDFSL